MHRINFSGKIIVLAIFAFIFLFAHNVLAFDFPPGAEATTTTGVTTTNNIEEAINAASTTVMRDFIAEPTIRVGLYKTDKPVKFTSDFIYEVWTKGEFAGTILAQDIVTLSYKQSLKLRQGSEEENVFSSSLTPSNYKNGIYSLVSDSLTVTSSDYIRLVPQDPQAFFTLTNYSRPVKGRGKVNFNVYRGTLEYRYSAKSKLPYVINELPLDSYVLGVAETYNTAPVEYIKALAVAARSYAYALTSKLPPTDKRMFDVYPTTVDQIYLGYNSELYMPLAAAAAADTAGEMVTYNGNPVITPYFSHSNGNTRSWKGKDRPWLKSVKAVYDKGKTMLGHGIGMSNNDAMKRAQKDGWTYDQILEYYYSSTTVEKIY